MGRLLRAVVACLVPAAFPALAERLPVRAFTTEDGLPSAFVQVIESDPRGFVWIGTRAGIARYDGERFVVSTVREGLPASTVTAFVPTADGGAWVGTQGGLCRFAAHPTSAPARGAAGDDAGPRCEPVPLGGASLSIEGLVVDSEGRLWVSDGTGLYRQDGDAFRRVGTGRPIAQGAGSLVTVEEGGRVVIRGPDGTERQIGSEAFGSVRRATGDGRGALWLATERGAHLLEIEGASAPRVTRRLGPEDGLPASYVLSVLVTRDGTTYLGTEAGLARLDPAGRLERISPAQGIPAIRIFSLAEDRAGNVWAGTPQGAFRITAGGLVSYPDVPSLPTEISSLVPDGDGVFVAGDRWTFGPFDGRVFRARTLVLPEGTRDLWAGQVVFRDSRGRVYALSSAGIFREERDGRARLFYAPLTPQDLPKRMLETPNGDLLIGSFHGLVIWERAREAFRRIEPFHSGGGAHRVLALAVSPGGTFFAGYDDGTLVRVRPGETRESRVAQPFGGTPLTALLFDRTGRLWAGGAEGGLALFADPDSDVPSVRRWGAAEGLPVTNVRCLVEDDFGRIYAGTVAGIVRLTPETQTLRHFTFADGLRGDFVLSAARDAKGRLWFGSMTGLSCLTPGPDPPSPRAQVLIERVTASGRSLPIAARGATGIEGLVLSAGQRDLSVRFGAVASRPGERLAYQVQLDGGPWSAPGPERSVSFVSLDPGPHLLLVRVAGSANVAEVSFDAAAAIHERLVVRVGALLLFAVAVALLARYRITKALELERTRLSIASDLHDGLGSGLARLSILAELARAETPPGGAPLLDEIGRTARAVAESLSDHVWAIDPGRDLVRTLSDRLARVSRELLEPLGIALTLDLPDEAASLLALPPAVRRHALLVGKEALHNAARHSGAKRVRLRLAVEGSRLVLEVEDDGSGLQPGGPVRDGHGLDSMRRRAAALGATLRVSPAPAGGTLVSFSVSV